MGHPPAHDHTLWRSGMWVRTKTSAFASPHTNIQMLLEVFANALLLCRRPRPLQKPPQHLLLGYQRRHHCARPCCRQVLLRPHQQHLCSQDTY